MPTTTAPERARRRALSRELLLVAGLYAAYSVSRVLVVSDPAVAHDNARGVLALEAAAGLDVEGGLARWLAGSTVLSVAAAYVYAALHYTVTPAVLVWLWRRRPDHYAAARAALLGATGVALVCYWLLPVAPPRLLSPEYPDVLALTSQWGWWGAEASAPQGLGGLTNQYAAMPSMHVGWAVWCGLVVARLTSSRAVRAVALGYPVLVAVVVVVTGNHYVLDAVAGALLVVAAARGVPRRSPVAVPVPGGQLPAAAEQPALAA